MITYFLDQFELFHWITNYAMYWHITEIVLWVPDNSVSQSAQVLVLHKSIVNFEYSNLPLQKLLVIAKDHSKWKKLLKALSGFLPDDAYVTGLSKY